MAPLSLLQTLDQAIGTPTIGCVNYQVLHSLLRSILGYLHLQDLPTLEQGHDLALLAGGHLPTKEHPGEEEGQAGDLGTGHELPAPRKDLLQGTAGSSQIADVATDMEQMKEKIEENESGVAQAMALSPDRLEEVGGIKAGQSHMAEEVWKIQEALGLGGLAPGLEGPGMQPGSLGLQAGVQGALVASEQRAGAASGRPGISDVNATSTEMQPRSPGIKTTTPESPTGTPCTQTSTLGMQLELPGIKTTSHGMQPGSSGIRTMTSGLQPESPGIQTTSHGMQPGSSGTRTTTSGLQPESPGIQTSSHGMQPGSSGTRTTTSGPQPESPGIQTTTPRMQPAHPGTQEEGEVAQPSHRDAEPDLPPQEAEVLAKVTPGALVMQRDARSTQLAQAEQAAAGTLCVETEEGLPQIRQLGHLYAALKEQVSQLAATKLDRSELEKLHHPTPEGDLESITSILADLQGQMSSLQGLSRDLQHEQGKIRQLEDAMAKLGSAGEDQSMDGRDQIIGQLGSMLQEIKIELKELGEQQMKTKATLQQVVAEEAKQQQEQPNKLRVTGESAKQEPAEAQASCPICHKDIGVQVGLLLQHYEKLQELVDYLMSRPTVEKAVRELPERSQDRELLKSFQDTIMQMQADSMKLSSVTDTLLGDLHQKERDIEALFHSLERLEKEKADKEELLLKAERSTLASKVSHAQFEAWVERLNKMNQEMLSRVTGLEQGLTQVQQQLSNGMDSKLDRVELEPFRQQLEERWKRSLEQLQEKLRATAAGDAAGTKKQLLEHFHCVSCDRPLSMLVPGLKITSIPSMPAVPPRFVGRPPTITELEQTQQHGHREQADKCRYPSMPRQCGGLHTVTQPLQRFQTVLPSTPRLQPPRTLLPIKAGIVKHNARELLAQDGHIYRDQTDGQLPALVSKKDFLRQHPKLSPRPLGPWDAGHLLLRPRSTSSFHSQPGTDASSDSHLLEASGLLQVQRDRSSSPQNRGSAVKPLSS